MPDENQQESVETKKDFGSDQKGIYRWLSSEVSLAEKEQKAWEERSKRIIKRYRDEEHTSKSSRSFQQGAARFNVLWSNVQTLQPALYARTPKPQVERRYKDQDPLGRVASEVLERAVDYSVKAYNFDDVMKACRDDYLLTGRGQAWVRYLPFMERKKARVNLQQKEMQLSDEVGQESQFVREDGESLNADAEIQQDESGFFLLEDQEELVYEEVKCDYLFWADFIHAPARRWDEVRWVGRKVMMSRDELTKRFGDKGAKTKLDHNISSEMDKDDELGPENEQFKRALVYEIWHKPDRKVYWFSRGFMDGPLEVQDDPLGLRDFFPCPRPLFATRTTDTLIPIPDFAEYQSQAQEIDDVTDRISHLTEALKVVGVYDAQHPEIQRMLEAGHENELIPVDNWAGFAQKGGLSGSIEFMDILTIGKTLEGLYNIRQTLKQDLFEITGLSDILRGATSPNETATAQQIKGQFATLRLADRQAEVQRFARDLIELKGEIIAEHFQPETLALMTGANLMSPEAPQQFEQAIELLRNDAIRSFRIDIETDSTVQIDEQLAQQSATQFLSSTGQLMKGSMELSQQMPQFLPVLMEMLLFNARKYKAGRNLEGLLEENIEEAKAFVQQQLQAAQQPQGPSPEQLEMQQKQQMAQFEAQLDAQKSQFEMALKKQESDAKVALAGTKQQLEVQKAQMKLGLERAEFEAETQLAAERLRAEMALKAQEAAEKSLQTAQAQQATGGAGAQEAEDTPKAFRFTRDSQGNKIAVEVPHPLAPGGKRLKAIKFSTDTNGEKVAIEVPHPTEEIQ